MARHVAIIRMSVHTTKVFTGELLKLNSTLLFSDRMVAPPAIQVQDAKVQTAKLSNSKSDDTALGCVSSFARAP